MIVFDVGANNANETKHFLDNGATVYAFEPNPIMINDMKTRLGKLPNFNLVESAVSDYEGTATFNLAGPNDPSNPMNHSIGYPNYGSSSLLDFQEGLDKTWAGRRDLATFAKISVNVMRLDTFVKKHNIKQIDYLHVDTQGQDLSVLKGLGEYLSIVKKGVVEAPTSKTTRIYIKSHTMVEIVKFLRENNFLIDKIDGNDENENEVNIYFSKI
jgi:FkbM family methyltransferase